MLLAGIIDENADLSFFERLAGHTLINLRDIRRINSYGVRAWIEGVRSVPRGTTFELVECPPSVVDQINMVAGFLGRGQVTSFLAPMECDRCHHAEERLFFTSEFRQLGRLPESACTRCGGSLHIDDVEEQYLVFAREAAD
jgi:hypothetical protein